jgi:hypothetical protein
MKREYFCDLVREVNDHTGLIAAPLLAANADVIPRIIRTNAKGFAVCDIIRLDA